MQKRLKSVILITPLSADGYPADFSTRKFPWDLIGDRELSDLGFSLFTGWRLPAAWEHAKTERHLRTTSPEVMKGYYQMWLETNFSADVIAKRVETPFLVVGGRQDLPCFQEQHLRKTFGAWYPNVELSFITDAGHYPMHEAPVHPASLIERFIGDAH